MCLIDTLKLGDIARFVVRSCVFCVPSVFIFCVIFTISSSFPLYSFYGSAFMMNGLCVL